MIDRLQGLESAYGPQAEELKDDAARALRE